MSFTIDEIDLIAFSHINSLYRDYREFSTIITVTYFVEYRYANRNASEWGIDRQNQSISISRQPENSTQIANLKSNRIAYRECRWQFVYVPRRRWQSCVKWFDLCRESHDARWWWKFSVKSHKRDNVTSMKSREFRSNGCLHWLYAFRRLAYGSFNLIWGFSFVQLILSTNPMKNSTNNCTLCVRVCV